MALLLLLLLLLLLQLVLERRAHWPVHCTARQRPHTAAWQSLLK
jgi:hypothetical protein